MPTTNSITLEGGWQFTGPVPEPAPSRPADPPPQPETAAASGRTVGDLLDVYIESLTGNTKRDCRSLLNKWATPALGHMPVDQVTSYHVEQLHAAIPPTRAANTVVDWLHAAFRRAERWAWIPRGTNPAAYRGEYKHPERPRRRVLSADERRLMWEHLEAEEASGVRFRILRSQAIQLLALTGMRKSEFLGVPWDAIDLDGEIPAAYITEHKTARRTGEDKVCYLSPEAVDLLRRIDTEGNVFPWKTACPLDKAWRELRKACGLEGTVIHDLRRTFWTLAGNAGVSVEDSAATAGHKNLRVHVDHYRVVSKSRRSEIAALCSSAMKG